MTLINLFNPLCWLLAGLLWAVAVWHWRQVKQQQFSSTEPKQTAVANFSQFSIAKAGRYYFWLLFGVIFLLTLIIFRPALGSEPVSTDSKPIDMIFVLDTSLSMGVKDGPGSTKRIQQGQEAIKQIISLNPGARYALISFDNEARVEAPLTSDSSTITANLESIPMALYTKANGSWLNTGLAGALKYIESNTSPDIANRQKMVIMISDGEQIGEKTNDWQSTVQQLTKLGVIIHTIGVGTTDGDKVPMDPTDPNEDTYVHDVRPGHDGYAISKLDETNLQAVAQAGHGQYLWAGSLGVNYGQLTANLPATDTNSTVNSTTTHGELYPYLALAAAILSIIFATNYYQGIKGPLHIPESELNK